MPPDLGEEAARAAIRAALGDDGYELSFHDEVVGNRSPADTPLMETIRRFIRREDAGARVAPLIMTGLLRLPLVAACVPRVRGLRLLPPEGDGHGRGLPLMHGIDERIPVADLGLAAAFYADLMQETLR